MLTRRKLQNQNNAENGVPKQSLTLHDLNLQPAQRGLMIGTTRAGKSTLMEYLIADFRKSYRNSCTLVIDTKPRFKATYDLDGMVAGRRYRNWRGGSHVPVSYRLPVGSHLSRQVWSIADREHIGACVIAQTDDRDMYGWLDRTIQEFYHQANKKNDLLLVVDEMMAFLQGRATHSKGVVTSIVSGGEKGIGFLGGTQRPKFVPNEAMTELTKLYAFEFDYKEDIKKLFAMGLPEEFSIPDERHYFSYYDKWTKTYIPRMILDL